MSNLYLHCLIIVITILVTIPEAHCALNLFEIKEIIDNNPDWVVTDDILNSAFVISVEHSNWIAETGWQWIGEDETYLSETEEASYNVNILGRIINNIDATSEVSNPPFNSMVESILNNYQSSYLASGWNENNGLTEGGIYENTTVLNNILWEDIPTIPNPWTICAVATKLSTQQEFTAAFSLLDEPGNFALLTPENLVEFNNYVTENQPTPAYQSEHTTNAGNPTWINTYTTSYYSCTINEALDNINENKEANN